jgi:hypothetical protein
MVKPSSDSKDYTTATPTLLGKKSGLWLEFCLSSRLGDGLRAADDVIDSSQSSDGLLRDPSPLVVETTAGPLKTLVEGTSNLGGHWAKPCPLRLSAADFLFCDTPPRFFGLGTPATGHSVSRQSLAPLLGEQFGR